MIIWTDYIKYRIALRGFESNKLENILRYSTERYFDRETQRYIVIGRHDDTLVMIAYERNDENVTPVTVHVVSRQQIRFRLRTGRLINE